MNPTRWFVDDEGSTYLAVMLAIVLAIAVMMFSIQVQWSQSVGQDVQFVADAGALAAANATTKVIILAQLFDAIMLSLNLVGILLQLVWAVMALIPFSRPAAEALKPALDKYINTRKAIAKSLTRVMEIANTAAPYLAVASASAVIVQNSGVINRDSTYIGTAIPVDGGDAPVFDFGEGEVTGKLAKTKGEIPDGGSVITDEDQGKMQKAEDDYEYARMAAEAAAENVWTLYRSLSGTKTLADVKDKWAHGYWLAVGDVKVQAKRYVTQQASGRTEASDDALRKDTNSAIDGLRKVEPQTYLKKLFVVTGSGTEYRYDSRAGKLDKRPASGEIDENTDYQISLSQAQSAGMTPDPMDDRALDWRAVEWWNSNVWTVWNGAPIRLTLLQTAIDARDDAEAVIKNSIDKAVEKLKAELQKYLGYRLGYKHPGSKGFLSIAIQLNGRKVPGYALPEMTGAGDVVVGPEVAISAARIYPKNGENAIKNMLNQVKADTKSASGPWKWMGSIFGGADFLMDAWGVILDSVRNAQDFTKDLITSIVGGATSFLPEGVSTLFMGWIEDAITKLFANLGIAPSELRAPTPALVNTSHVTGLDGYISAAYQLDKLGSEMISKVQGKLTESTTYTFDFGPNAEVEIDLLKQLGLSEQVDTWFDQVRNEMQTRLLQFSADLQQ